MRTFVLVTATKGSREAADRSSAGIRKLKRGLKLDDFIVGYLDPFKLGDVEHFVRANTHMVISRTDGMVLTWGFTGYSENDLLSAVKHLSKDELLRDLKELLPLRDNWS